MKESEIIEKEEKYVKAISDLSIPLQVALLQRRLEYVVATINEQAHYKNHGCNLPMNQGFCVEKYEFDKKMDARIEAWNRVVHELDPDNKLVEIQDK